jgi:hypothetical protein
VERLRGPSARALLKLHCQFGEEVSFAPDQRRSNSNRSLTQLLLFWAPSLVAMAQILSVAHFYAKCYERDGSLRQDEVYFGAGRLRARGEKMDEEDRGDH